mgnify:CR=1 FL=1
MNQLLHVDVNACFGQVPVAVKFMLSGDRDELQRQQREAALSRMASHPHLVRKGLARVQSMWGEKGCGQARIVAYCVWAVKVTTSVHCSISLPYVHWRSPSSPTLRCARW